MSATNRLLKIKEKNGGTLLNHYLYIYNIYHSIRVDKKLPEKYLS